MLSRLMEFLADLHVMNTLGKQVACLAAIGVAGYLVSRHYHKPLPDVPLPVPPRGGYACLVAGEGAVEAFREAMARPAPRSPGRGGAMESDRLLERLDAALTECSVARGESERTGTEAMRRALERAKEGLGQAGMPSWGASDEARALLQAVDDELAIARGKLTAVR